MAIWERGMEGKTACIWSTVSHKDTLAPPPPPLPPPDAIRRAAGLRVNSSPSHPFPSPLDLERFSVTSPKVEDGLHFGDCEYDFGQQQWLCTNFWLSDRTLRSRDRILEFSQEIVKICAAAKNSDTRVYFGMSGRYNQPVQYGRDAAHKSRAAWAVISLGVYMSERQHIYEDLNESSSARPGGSQQLEIIVNGRQTFLLIFLLGAEILTLAKILSHAYIFTRRLHFVYPPIF